MKHVLSILMVMACVSALAAEDKEYTIHLHFTNDGSQDVGFPKGFYPTGADEKKAPPAYSKNVKANRITVNGSVVTIHFSEPHDIQVVDKLGERTVRFTQIKLQLAESDRLSPMYLDWIMNWTLEDWLLREDPKFTAKELVDGIDTDSISDFVGAKYPDRPALLSVVYNIGVSTTYKNLTSGEPILTKISPGVKSLDAFNSEERTVSLSPGVGRVHWETGKYKIVSLHQAETVKIANALTRLHELQKSMTFNVLSYGGKRGETYVAVKGPTFRPEDSIPESCQKFLSLRGDKKNDL